MHYRIYTRMLLWRLRHHKKVITVFFITTFLLLSLSIQTPPSFLRDNPNKFDCNNLQSLYYVKIHKTGSTTFQNIIFRLGMQRDLFFALFDCSYGMPYPNAPNDSYLYSHPTHPKFQGRFHILTDHAMFDTEATKSYIPEDTPVITLLRHPLDQLSSTFEFFKMAEKFGMKAETTEEALKMYLDNPTRYEQLTDYAGCQSSRNYSQTRNPQCHHLGLVNQSTDDPDLIYRFIHGLDNKVSLVLILEKFDESLLLFRRMFCLSTKDILHLNLFSQSFLQKRLLRHKRKRNVPQLSKTKEGVDEQKQREHFILKHRSWSIADYELYNYFLRKHTSIVQKLGAEFQAELESFRKIKDKVRSFCAQSCTVFEQLRHKSVQHARKSLNEEILVIPSTAWNGEFTVSRTDCLLMMIETAVYNDAIKLKQWPDICTRVETKEDHTGRSYPVFTDKVQCDKNEALIPYFPWSSLQYKEYFYKDICLAQF